MLANSDGGQDPPPPSPYAAPNTPIASAKRLRTSNRKDHTSPLPVRKILVTDETVADSESNSDATDRSSRKTSIGGSTGPAKALFSPALRLADSEDDNKAVSELEAEKTKTKNDEVKAMDEDESTAVDVEEEFNPYYFISTLPPHSSVSVRGKLCIPKDLNPDRLTLVLDLDETLVHCTVEQIPNPDLTFPVTFNGTFYQVYVRKRPYLDEFLATVAKSFEVIVFTASQKVYAETLLNRLDETRTLIQHRLYRDSCLNVCGNYVKDLCVVNRDLAKTVLVDNSPHAYAYQIDNGIPIESWFDDSEDQELLKLLQFLRRLEQHRALAKNSSDSSSSSNGDVRPIIREHFKTYQLVDKAASGLPVRQTAPPF